MAAGIMISGPTGTASIWFEGTLMSSPSQNPSRWSTASFDRWPNSSQPRSEAGKGFTARNTVEPVPANDVSSRFGRRLRELRQKNALTQSDMARKFGIDRSYISDVERGRTSISLPLLEVIALGLRISLSDLFRDI
jgi:DNA-binding XRE family transcriptional regulator